MISDEAGGVVDELCRWAVGTCNGNARKFGEGPVGEIKKQGAAAGVPGRRFRVESFYCCS